MFPSEQLLSALLIFFARVADVSLGTFRHAMIIRGKRLIALCLAFAEALIWVYAISRVLTEIRSPSSALAYAAGFACGTFVGITIEGLFKIGDQVMRVFSHEGDKLAGELRARGYPVTVFDGRGRDGAVSLLLIQVRRRGVESVSSVCRALDPSCFIVVDDVRHVSKAPRTPRTPRSRRSPRSPRA
jgi:uncharacterized protein YebE (UPF0316 family)